MVSGIKDLSAQAEAATKHPLLELSVVIPTYKERQNVAPLVASLEAALQGLNWEVIFVDDHSPDHTADAIRELALTNPRDSRAYRAAWPVFCLHRRNDGKPSR
jgi:glycosyltransferase involved in cell wall biosynthesis